MKIALAGNPNSGKTTLFNALTGSNQYVGNWPGVTVEKKEGKYHNDKEIIITDLPGIYSLSPYTLEEVVARNYLLDEKPDGILNIVDGSNIERNLYLTTQIIELGIPMIVAINMIDIVNKRGDIIDVKKLEEQLGVKVVTMSALNKENIDSAIDVLKAEVEKHTPYVCNHHFAPEIEHALAHIEEACLHDLEGGQQRFYSIKLFERDAKIQEKLGLAKETLDHIDGDIKEVETKLNDDSESIITSARYEYIESVIAKVYQKKNREALTLSDKIDRIVTNRWLALPIFVLVMTGVYWLSVSGGGIGTIGTDWVNDVLFGEIIPPAITAFLESINTAPWLTSLIVDGIVAGLGAVLGFLPQMIVLFICLALLEGCGYMARIAFIMDRVFRKFGLSGKSFIPMLIGVGCGVPAVMASRTIESDRDRKMTIMTTTFIPCSAKLPVIAMIAGALFDGVWWVAPSAYFLGMFAIVTSGIILKKTKMFEGDPAPFVMELPAYHMPTFSNVFYSVWERATSFIKKAGTIILLSTIFIWFITNFGFTSTGFGMISTEEIGSSIAAKIGGFLAPVFAPLGFGDWGSTVATIMGLVAKENVVSTFGIIHGFAEVAEDGVEFWDALRATYTVVSAYSLLAFNLLCAPCFAAIGSIKREMSNSKWTWFAILYQTAYAYVAAFIIYQLGNLFVFGTFGFGTILGFVALAGFLYLLFRKPKASKSEVSNA